jgi:ariadne-1
MARYVFHYERFNNHGQSGLLAKKQMGQIKKSAKLLHDVKNYPDSELTFFEGCAKEIQKCRQVLKWTYPVRFYGENAWKAH